MKRDLINDAIKYLSPDNLKILNKKYGTNYTKNELFIDDEIDKGKPEVFCVHVTDLHYGKKTHNYDPDVCMSRVIDYINNLKVLSEIEHRSRNFSTFCILDTGDMLDGFGIYPTQGAGHSAIPDMNKQIEGVVEHFYSPLIKFGRDNFPKVLVCKVPGNHGRLGKYQAEGSNLDCMTTTMLRVKYSDTRNVKVIGSDILQQTFDIDGHRILLFHGAGKNLRSYNGLPWYSINRALTGWANLDDLDFDIACIGHFHQMAEIPVMTAKRKMCLMSGTMATGDDFSITNYASDGDQRWWCFGLHPDRKGTTFQYKVDLVK